ncbi:MAG: hypothetical protein ACI4TB_02630 [Lachnospiraceae bacterium]
MDGIKRNLRYWGWVMEQVAAIGLLCFAILSLAWGTEDIGEIPHQLLRLYAGCFSIFGIYLGCMFGTNNDRYLSFTISMGSTRRDAFIGMEVMLHVMGVEILLISFLANALLPTEDKKSYITLLLAGICCSFLAGFFGNVVTVLRSRLQGAMGNTISIVVMLCCVVAFLIAVGMEPEVMFSLLTKAWMLVISILLDAVAGVICYLAAMKTEVRV